MPDQNNPNDNQIPQVFPEDTNIPPIPSGMAQDTSFPNPIQTITDALPQEGNIPSGLPPIITSDKPKKKFGGKMIATILGIFLLIGAIGAGVILVGQKQLFQQKAAGDCTDAGGSCKDRCSADSEDAYRKSECGKANWCCVPKKGAPKTDCDDKGGTCKDHCLADSEDAFGTLQCGSNWCCVPKAPPSCTGAGGCYSATSCSNIGKCNATGSCLVSGVRGICCQECGRDATPTPGSTPTPTPTPTPAGAKMYYCRTDNYTCIQTTDLYTDLNACASNVQLYGQKPNSGVCYTSSSNCGTSCKAICPNIAPPAPNFCPGIGCSIKPNYDPVTGCIVGYRCECPTPTPGETAVCQNIKAYDTNWGPIIIAQLSTLKPGDKIRFTVSGTPASKIDKARFIINGTTRPETTNKAPWPDVFYDEYTIPAETTSFTINAQLHHVTLGWF